MRSSYQVLSGAGEEKHGLDDRLAAVISGWMFRGFWVKAASCHLLLTGAGLS